MLPSRDVGMVGNMSHESEKHGLHLHWGAVKKHLTFDLFNMATRDSWPTINDSFINVVLLLAHDFTHYILV